MQASNVLYCLWLVPPADQATEISKIISRLASFHDSPLFCPHITLASSISDSEGEQHAKEWFRIVSERLKPHKEELSHLQFDPPRTGDTRHQCVLVEVQKGAGFEVMQRRGSLFAYDLDAN